MQKFVSKETISQYQAWNKEVFQKLVNENWTRLPQKCFTKNLQRMNEWRRMIKEGQIFHSYYEPKKELLNLSKLNK